MRSERGTATLWVLGLTVAVLFLGGLSLDLWRGIATRRELSAMADAAATAAANGVVEASARGGVIVLDEARAREIALATLAQDGRIDTLRSIAVDVIGDEVVVTLEDDVPLSLLGIFAAEAPFLVRVNATARPQPRA
ncbi:MAG: pilus assembly protein TadG-related protein [Actinomycetota bacterium]